jgi:hypothetical protein
VNLSRRDALSGLMALAQGIVKDSRPATVAFNYAAKSSLPDLKFLANFDVLVTGGILSTDQRQIFQLRKTRFVLYRWSSAFYPAEDEAEHSWQAGVRTRAKDWLLAPDPVPGGAASKGKAALWYDFGNAEVISAHADHIRETLQANGYHGVFLDTLGFEAVPPQLQKEFQKRHPGKSYDQAQAQFISTLREKLGQECIIFTNQGYRKPELFLSHSDFDLVENTCTSVRQDGITEFRPWHKIGAEWESIEIPMTALVLPAARSFPRVQFVHLNYAQGSPAVLERAVGYACACARLWNQTSFVALSTIQKPIHSRVYFTRLGAPLTSSYEEDRDNGIAWRRFQNGVVALNSSHIPYRIRKLQLALPDPPRGYAIIKHR